MKLEMKPHEQSGLLITFCGLDGCGKTTQITLLKAALEEIGINISLTKQPTDFVRKSDIFRTYMDNPNHNVFDYRALSLLCASDRVQHTYGIIKPLLQHGNTVISDRYFYSCLANLRARGYKEDFWIYEIAKSILKPDICFFLDVPVETAVSRVRQRPAERNKYIDMELQYRLKEEYFNIAKENEGIILDGEKRIHEIHQNIFQAVIKKVKERNIVYE
ncbi:MAG: dTMP kinase [Ruminococcaceae bacterium]|nr:dTMP kinase [Oscillospiraceae bacterium]